MSAASEPWDPVEQLPRDELRALQLARLRATFGLEVNRLIRVSFGPFQLLDLKPGEAETVKRRVLAEQLGPKLAREFGLVEDATDARAGGAKGKRPKGEGAAR